MIDPIGKPVYIFDTSPLVTACGVLSNGDIIIRELLQHIEIIVVDTVANEATINLRYADARLIKELLDQMAIQRLPVPMTRVDHLIDAYPKLGVGKGQGERDTIKLGIVHSDERVVIDDQQAYFVAARFDLSPITLLDLIVELVRDQKLQAKRAIQLVTPLERRYTAIAIQHTLYKINEAASS